MQLPLIDLSPVLSFAPHEFCDCLLAPEQALRHISRVFDLVTDSFSDVARQWLVHIASNVTLKRNAAVFGFRRLIECLSARPTGPAYDVSRFLLCHLMTRPRL